jgi:hypothetical protein
MKYLVVFLLLTVGFSCKKKKAEFVLKGVVTDITFDQKHAGAEIKLYQVPVGSTSEVLIGSGTTGSDGSYSFTFDRDRMEKYIIRVSKPGYFDIEKEVFFSEMSVSEDNVRNYSTTAKSWVKLTFHNLNPLPGDDFKYIKQSGKEGCSDCCPISEQHYFGALDTSIYCINDGNTYYSYLYWLIGTTTQGLQSTLTVPFDTTEIILNY